MFNQSQRKYENKLVPGLAYLEFWKLKTRDDFGNPLTSKKGDPMIKIQWSALDREGNTGVVFDFITQASRFRLKNVENALGLTEAISFYDEERCCFNLDLIEDCLHGRTRCGASILIDDYGAKVDKYCPLEYYSVVAKASTREKPEYSEQKKMENESRLVPESSVEDDIDDLPF